FGPAPLIVVTAALMLCVTLIYQTLQLYRVTSFRMAIRSIFFMSLCWTGLFSATFALVQFSGLGPLIPIVWLQSWWAAGLVALIIERMFLSSWTKYLRNRGRLDRRTVIVGGGPSSEALLEGLTQQIETDLRIYGIFDDRCDGRSPDEVGGYA